MSGLLKIWIMSVRSSLFFLLSAIAPKMKVPSRAISKSDAPSSANCETKQKKVDYILYLMDMSLHDKLK